jgi:uncharacterized protein YbjT (DUF2867 family)
VLILAETHGKLTEVKHFDSKAHVEAYAREVGVPSTFFMPGVFMPGFMDNFRKGEDGNYSFTTGWDAETTMVPFLDPSGDSGLWVAAILLNLDSTLGKRIAAAGDVLTPNSMAEAIAAVSSKKATINHVTFEQYQSFLPAPIAEEITANMRLIASPGYYVGEPADAVQQGLALIAKSGLRKPHTWKEFVEKNFKA